MIDYGLIAFFALQCIMVFAVYHAWNGIKRELRDVLALKADITRSTEAGNVATAAMTALSENVEKRVAAAEAIPGALVKRVAAVEESMKQSDLTLLAHGDRITSLGARLSASLRAVKNRIEDTGPASRDEDAIPPSAESSPGPLFDQQGAQLPGIPPGFGVLKRRVG